MTLRPRRLAGLLLAVAAAATGVGAAVLVEGGSGRPIVVEMLSRPPPRAAPGTIEPLPGPPPAAAPAGVDHAVVEELTRADLTDGMERVTAKVEACGDLYPVAGVVTVRLTIAASGRVMASKVIRPELPERAASCIERAARGALFKPFQRSLVTLTWEFALATAEAPPSEE